MIINTIRLNRALGASLFTILLSGGVFADEAKLDGLFERLKMADASEYEQIDKEIRREWSKSGSDSMDLLLKRGRDALDAGELDIAIEHFTALTDHAPNFAEGFNMRATAFFAAEKYGLSLDDIERTLALNPRHYGAMLGLGSILVSLGEEKKALEIYKRAQELNPHRPDLNDAIARLEPKFGDVSL